MILSTVGLVVLGFVSANAMYHLKNSRNITKENIAIAVLVLAVVAVAFFMHELFEYYAPAYRRHAGRMTLATTLIAGVLGALLTLIVPERFGGIRFRR